MAASFFLFQSRKLINTFIFSNNHQYNYTKTIIILLVASGDVNIGDKIKDHPQGSKKGLSSRSEQAHLPNKQGSRQVFLQFFDLISYT